MPGRLSDRLAVESQPDGVALKFVARGGVFSFSMSPVEVSELIGLLERHKDGPGEPVAAKAKRKVRRGTGAPAVMTLIDGGVLNAGDELTMRSGGLTHRAKVLEDGSFSVDGQIERSPTEAACVAAGERRSGWKMWTTADGETHEELRWRVRARSFKEGAAGSLVEAWVDYVAKRRLSPGRRQPGVFGGFCEEQGLDPAEVAEVFEEWFEWCEANRWTRVG